MKIIGIAGGSGAGKSTVSYVLQDAQPEQIEVLNLDDYQKLPGDPTLPTLDGMINWDHPDAIRWDDLLADIQTLQNGQPVTIQSWAHRSNPDYHQHRTMIPRMIEPKPILIIEGYLALYNSELRERYDTSFYLDIDDATRTTRRDKTTIITDVNYETKILQPMHQQFVEPTKQYTNHIIDVSNRSINELYKIIIDLL